MGLRFIERRESDYLCPNQKRDRKSSIVDARLSIDESLRIYDSRGEFWVRESMNPSWHLRRVMQGSE